MVATLRQRSGRGPGSAASGVGPAAVVAGVWALLIGTGSRQHRPDPARGRLLRRRGGVRALGRAGGFAALTPVHRLYRCHAVPLHLTSARPRIHPSMRRLRRRSTRLLAVIRRAQYPPRTPLDDPTVPHGPDNPGRTLGLMAIQFWRLLRVLHLAVGQVGAAAGSRSPSP